MKDITGGEFVGDFRNGAIDYGWDTFDDATKLKKRAIELNNGHAAMMGILPLWSTNNWAFLFSPLIKLYAAHRSCGNLRLPMHAPPCLPSNLLYLGVES